MTVSTATTILLIRHGETDWNREGRLQGWAPVPLNDRGRRQVRRLGRHVAAEYEVDRLLSSDLRRTRETAALVVAAGVDADPEFDPVWRERDLGVYQGLTGEQVNREYPSFSVENGLLALEERPDGGERLVDSYERSVDAWERLCADPAGDTVLVVTHGGPITGVLAHVRGDDLLTAIASYTVGNCTLAEFRVDGNGTAQVHRVADQPGPPSTE